MHWSAIREDIVFDEFGDIELLTGDISTTTYKEEILRQHIFDRIKSSQGDYRLFPMVGSGIIKTIGQKISEELEDEIENRIKQALTYDGFLTNSELSVACMIVELTAHIAIEIIASRDLFRNLPISLSFNLSTGVVSR